MKMFAGSSEPRKIPGLPDDWRDQIQADLEARLEAGGTLPGIRPDGTHIARTEHGERALDGHDNPPDPKSD